MQKLREAFLWTHQRIAALHQSNHLHVVGAIIGFIVLFNLSLPPYDLSFLRWVAFIPLLYLLSTPALSLPLRGICVLASVYGALLWYGNWFFSVTPLTWIGIEGHVASLLLVAVFWLYFWFILSLPSLALVLLSTRVSLLLFPVLWVVQEIARSYLFYVAAWGPGSAWGDHFELGAIAHSLHDNALLLGVLPYLSSAGAGIMIGAVNVIFFFTLEYLLRTRSTHRTLAIFTLGTLLLSLALTELPIRQATPSEPAPAAGTGVGTIVLHGNNLFQLGYSARYYEAVHEAYAENLERALQRMPSAHIVVVPENAEFLRYTPLDNSTLATFLEDAQTVFVDHGIRDSEPVSIVRTAGKETLVHKQFLMPFGEFQLYAVGYLTEYLGGSDWFSRVTTFRGFTPAPPESTKVVPTALGGIGILTCSESLSASLRRSMIQHTPALIAVQQRLSVFGDNKKIHAQFRAVLKITAATVQRPIAVAVDGAGGPSYIIDAQGTVVAESTDETPFALYTISP